MTKNNSKLTPHVHLDAVLAVLREGHIDVKTASLMICRMFATAYEHTEPQQEPPKPTVAQSKGQPLKTNPHINTPLLISLRAKAHRPYAPTPPRTIEERIQRSRAKRAPNVSYSTGRDLYMVQISRGGKRLVDDRFDCLDDANSYADALRDQFGSRKRYWDARDGR